jgi:hypothetical protein
MAERADVPANLSIVEGKFDRFLESARGKAEVRVFLCGKGIDQTKTLLELAHAKADKRAYLWERLEKEHPGCTVLLGEHDHLIAAYGRIFQKSDTKDPKSVNLARFEATLSRHVHLIVLFPESAGSLAELGLFACPGGVAEKLFVIVEKWRETEPTYHNGYLARGPMASVKSAKGRIKYLDYDDLEAIYNAISEVVEGIFEDVTTKDIFIQKDL